MITTKELAIIISNGLRIMLNDLNRLVEQDQGDFESELKWIEKLAQQKDLTLKEKNDILAQDVGIINQGLKKIIDNHKLGCSIHNIPFVIYKGYEFCMECEIDGVKKTDARIAAGEFDFTVPELEENSLKPKPIQEAYDGIYTAVMDEHTCGACDNLNGAKVVNRKLPNSNCDSDMGCRCVVEQVPKEKAVGGVVEGPIPEMIPQPNPISVPTLHCGVCKKSLATPSIICVDCNTFICAVHAKKVTGHSFYQCSDCASKEKQENERKEKSTECLRHDLKYRTSAISGEKFCVECELEKVAKKGKTDDN